MSDTWSIIFTYMAPSGSYVQSEVFRSSQEEALKAATGIKTVMEKMGMTFLWSYVSIVSDDIPTLEDYFYESMTMH